MTDGVVIVGASHAGIALAGSLRALGYRDRVTVIGDESSAPYQRPPLSKKLLVDGSGRGPLPLRSVSFFENRSIELRVGTTVRHADLDAGHVVTSDGETMPFEQLALATGAGARQLDVPGSDLVGVAYLRDATDAQKLTTLASAANSIVVIGGGFIGLEVAAAMADAGKSVVIVEAADRLLARSVSVVASSFFEQVHRSKGVRVILNVTVSRITGRDGAVSEVHLSDGAVVPADVVVVGIGAVPRTSLAETMGLDISNGIVVDRFARTSDPRVVALGDVAVFPHPLEHDAMVRFESVQNADDQARVAARTILGELLTYSSVPWFWSDQFEFKLQMVGAPSYVDRTVVRRSPGTLSVLLYREGLLVGGEFVNMPADFLAVRRAIGSGGQLPADVVAGSDQPLKVLAERC